MNQETRRRLSRRSRIKGKSREREIVNLLKKAGIPAQRVPMSGSVKTHPGDVTISDKVYSVKARKDGLDTLYAWAEGFQAVFIRRDNSPWLVVEPLDEWMRKMFPSTVKSE